jgi:Fur family peroxide stress response transcriptional regulator
LDARARRTRLDAFRRLCRDKRVLCTPQRRLVFEVLLDLETHPTADEIAAALERRLPGASRATVYRNLEILVGLGVITKVCHPGAAVRYDVRTDVHHHLVCLRCNAIVDFNDERLNALPVPDTSGLGFVVRDCRVQLRGTCRLCRELEEKR